MSSNGSSYRGNQNNGSRQYTESSTVNLPSDYLKHGYTKPDNEYDIRYVTDIAETIGRTLTIPPNDTSTSKVRDYFKAIELTHRQFMAGSMTEGKAIFELAKLKSPINNSRKKGNASKYFQDFMYKNIDLVTKSSGEAFKINITGFKCHFEAVLGFMH